MPKELDGPYVRDPEFMRQLQPACHHPPPATEEERMTVEETIAKLETVPSNARLLRQIGVRDSVHRVRARRMLVNAPGSLPHCQ